MTTGVHSALTWPLARVVGAKAWIGLGIFAAILTVMTLVVLLAPTHRRPVDRSDFSRRDEPEPELFDPEQTVEVPVEDSIDLHPFPPRDIPDVVEAYLEAATERGFQEVRLIHGRGIGVQRGTGGMA